MFFLLKCERRIARGWRDWCRNCSVAQPWWQKSALLCIYYGNSRRSIPGPSLHRSSTGASGGGEDHCVNMILFQLCADLGLRTLFAHSLTLQFRFQLWSSNYLAFRSCPASRTLKTSTGRTRSASGLAYWVISSLCHLISVNSEVHSPSCRIPYLEALDDWCGQVALWHDTAWMLQGAMVAFGGP